MKPYPNNNPNNISNMKKANQDTAIINNGLFASAINPIYGFSFIFLIIPILSFSDTVSFELSFRLSCPIQVPQ